MMDPEMLNYEQTAFTVTESQEVPTDVAIAESLQDHIIFDMIKDVLVKPLAPIMIKREFEIPVVTNKIVEDGESINEFEETKKEIREVESNFATGVILKMPTTQSGLEWTFKIGDTVCYNKRFTIEFDLFKDSVLVKPYDIIAIKK